ncbi:HNH endonuclease [Mucilaginibacter angelicae]|uniref:HNH endonuclease n=1 Tax=Mucilaginibacter angelicae TaxID=869718 RepID=A0ABV6LHJ0_9SPHI
MQKIYKDYLAIPAGLSGVAYQARLALSLTEQNTHEFSSSIYRHPTVLAELSRIYYNKCAFCESDTTAGAPMQVEHYRPKKAVVGAVPAHTGYYWLAYQWSNLLLSCASCNNKKRNHFPVNGMRVAAPPFVQNALDTTACQANSPDLLGELAELINPELEQNPMVHFEFYPDGTIMGNTPQGLQTIRVCGLDRDQLTIKRKEFYDTYLDRFTRYFKDYQDNGNEATLVLQLKNAILEIFSHVSKNKPYREFAAKCLENFKTFFIDRFQAGEARPLAEAYNQAMSLS